MSSENNKYLFTNPEDFNSKTQFICEDAYSEYQKFKKFFSQNFSSNGHSAFPPTIAVFNFLKEFVGIITCRDCDDKSDLYCAMAEMLYFPMSLSSELFIIANDINIKSDAFSDINDALAISFVTVENCLILTVPYTYNDKEIIFHEDKAYISKITSSTDESNPVGFLVEMFFVFSHSRTTGPFTPSEILAYFDSAGFSYEIFHPERMSDNRTFVPFSD